MAKLKITITEVLIDLQDIDAKALPDLMEQAFTTMLGRAQARMEPSTPASAGTPRRTAAAPTVGASRPGRRRR